VLDELISWFKEHQRPLPWRESYDPYHVWISEVMLQQTQVETALPYYERFIREFPSVEHLARADEQRVLALWSGLGYYRRAKNLMSAARLLKERYGGHIPSDFDALIGLPGVGQYMAGAILSIAFNKPFPIVDGNVRRVLSRIHGLVDDRPKALWDAASRIVRRAEPRLVNQALMELGATVCSFRSPRCLLCPVQRSCIAFRSGMQEKIPPVKKRPATVRLQLFAVVHKKGVSYLMKQSEGLWEFPLFPQLPSGSLRQVGTCRHTITHHRLNVSVYEGEIADPSCEWTDPRTVPVSALTRKILQVHGAPRLQESSDRARDETLL
jgi:A/G-specific adenine glycosylase